VLELERIDNLELAKQVLRLLEKENERLHERLRVLAEENDKLRGTEGRLQLELTQVQEHLARVQQRLFGASSEKQPRPGKEEKPPADEKTSRRGHGHRPQLELAPRVECHTLAAEELSCDKCGHQMHVWPHQFEEAEEITVVRRRYELVTHKRQKYRCTCNANVVTAPAPPRLIPGGRYSLEFAVEVAGDKYADHLPLERQIRRMLREGLEVTTTVLWDYLDALARYLEPSYEGIGDLLFRERYLHLDETTWRLLLGRPAQRWWLWSAASTRAVYFWFHPGRSVDAALDFLAGYRGKLIVDGYRVYKSLARALPGLLCLVNCWAHARRKFVEAQKHYPAPCQPILSWIQQLYRLEARVPDPATLTGRERRRALKRRWKLRRRYARPLIKAIRTWALRQSALPGTSLHKAITYLIHHWDGLTRFLDDPALPLDNNLVERELRSPVIGRKNHYGSRSQRGTEVAAIFYTLIGTARLCGENPKDYLLRAARAAIEQPGTVTLPRGLGP
jgi:transposase